MPSLAPVAVSWLDLATLGIAVLGLLLAARTAWREHVRDRVQLRVTPKIAYIVGPRTDPRPRFAFTVANLSAFAVTIAEVGFLYRDSETRGAIAHPDVEDGGAWPRRLEPHEAVTVYSRPVEEQTTPLAQVRCAYAKTSTDVRVEGTSPALERVVREGAVPPPPRKLSARGQPGSYVVDRYSDG